MGSFVQSSLWCFPCFCWHLRDEPQTPRLLRYWSLTYPKGNENILRVRWCYHVPRAMKRALRTCLCLGSSVLSSVTFTDGIRDETKAPKPSFIHGCLLMFICTSHQGLANCVHLPSSWSIDVYRDLYTSSYSLPVSNVYWKVAKLNHACAVFGIQGRLVSDTWEIKAYELELCSPSSAAVLSFGSGSSSVLWASLFCNLHRLTEVRWLRQDDGWILTVVCGWTRWRWTLPSSRYAGRCSCLCFCLFLNGHGILKVPTDIFFSLASFACSLISIISLISGTSTNPPCYPSACRWPMTTNDVPVHITSIHHPSYWVHFMDLSDTSSIPTTCPTLLAIPSTEKQKGG